MNFYQAQTIAHLSPDALAMVNLSPGETYQISPQVLKDNVQMGMIATSANFQADKQYSHHLFTSNDASPIDFSPAINGEIFDKLYFYLMLPFTESVSMPNSYISQYYVGWRDAELEHSVNLASMINVSMERGSDGEYSPLASAPPSVAIPYDPLAINAANKVVLDGADYSLPFALITGTGNKGSVGIEKSAHIQVLQGNTERKLIASIDPPYTGPYMIPLTGPGESMPVTELIALVSPTVNPANPHDFTFEVGDPEKDGKVSIRTV